MRFLTSATSKILRIKSPTKSSNIIPAVMSEVNSSTNSNLQEPQTTTEKPLSPKENNNVNSTNHPKLKILAFHGYRQNGNTFRAKTGSFRKAVSKYAQINYLSAPHKVVSDDGAGDEDGRSWWFSAEDNSFSGKCLGGPALGFEATLKLIEDTVSEHGPFHGFMGFSQGACLVGILAAMQQKGYLPYTFHFAIITSGFRSGSLVHKGFYDEEMTLPSLHVYGESDSIIPKEMSEALISLFVNPVVAEHSGGHYVACSGSIKEAYIDFLHEVHKDIHETKNENDNEEDEE